MQILPQIMVKSIEVLQGFLSWWVEDNMIKRTWVLMVECVDMKIRYGGTVLYYGNLIVRNNWTAALYTRQQCQVDANY